MRLTNAAFVVESFFIDVERVRIEEVHEFQRSGVAGLSEAGVACAGQVDGIPTPSSGALTGNRISTNRRLLIELDCAESGAHEMVVRPAPGPQG